MVVDARRALWPSALADFYLARLRIRNVRRGEVSVAGPVWHGDCSGVGPSAGPALNELRRPPMSASPSKGVAPAGYPLELADIGTCVDVILGEISGPQIGVGVLGVNLGCSEDHCENLAKKAFSR